MYRKIRYLGPKGLSINRGVTNDVKGGILEMTLTFCIKIPGGTSLFTSRLLFLYIGPV